MQKDEDEHEEERWVRNLTIAFLQYPMRPEQLITAEGAQPGRLFVS